MVLFMSIEEFKSEKDSEKNISVENQKRDTHKGKTQNIKMADTYAKHMFKKRMQIKNQLTIINL